MVGVAFILVGNSAGFTTPWRYLVRAVTLVSHLFLEIFKFTDFNVRLHGHHGTPR